MNKIKITIFTFTIGVFSACSCNDNYVGRVEEKLKIGSVCKTEYNWQTKSGVIKCSEEYHALKLDDGGFNGRETCYVSESIYNNTEIGSIFVCNYDNENNE